MFFEENKAYQKSTKNYSNLLNNSPFSLLDERTGR